MKKQKEFEPDYLHIPYIVMDMQPADRFVFGAIYMFCNLSQKKCTASNVAIGKMARVSPESVSNSLIKLEEKGFIKRHFKDNNKRTRDFIECLIGYVKIPSTRDIDTISRLNQIPSTDEQIYNTNNTTTTNVVATHQFNLSEEIKKLLSYKTGDYRWLRIIGLFIAYRHLPFTNTKQINELKSRFKKCAESIATFDEQRVERAFAFCDRMKDNQGNKINWNLSTVEKQLLTNPNL